MKWWALGAALFLCGCPPCQRLCHNGGREQLIRDFQVLPQAVNCSDEKWVAPRDCQECAQMLAREYGVTPTTCEDDAYLEPRP